MVSVRLVPGKGDFVRRKLPDGGSEELCLCKYNADFSVGGCITQVLVSHLQEVIDNNGGYAPGNFELYRRRGEINQRCLYCYDLRKNGGQVTPKTVDEKTLQDFREKQPRVVRLGKSTECGHAYYYQTFAAFLEMCRGFNTAIIFPTKAFPFGIEGAKATQKYADNNDSTIAKLAKSVRMPKGRDLAQRLIEAKASLHYSLGFDALEPGAVSQGFPNAWRIEQALQYHKNRVNVSLTVVCDVSQSFKENTQLGSPIEEALRARAETGINVRVLPLRPNSNFVAQFIRGIPFCSLTDSGHHQTMPLGLEGIGVQCIQAPYLLASNNKAIPAYFHLDFQALVDEGIGICGAIGDTEYCDLCNTVQEKRIVLPRSELAEVTFSMPIKEPTKVGATLVLRKLPKRPNAKARALRDHPRLRLG